MPRAPSSATRRIEVAAPPAPPERPSPWFVAVALLPLIATAGIVIHSEVAG